MTPELGKKRPREVRRWWTPPRSGSKASSLDSYIPFALDSNRKTLLWSDFARSSPLG